MEPVPPPEDFEITISKIQNMGKNHLSALGVETNGSTALHAYCWPRRQKQYVRTYLLHELSNWGTWPDEQELYVVVLLFVELLKRRDEFAGVVGLPYLNEPLSLETLEQTVRAKLRVGPGVSGVYPDHRLCRSILAMLTEDGKRNAIEAEQKARVAEAVAVLNTKREDVEFVMSYLSCSRSKAAKALYMNDGDIVDAVMDLKFP